MKTRHRVALGCVLAALVILNVKDRLEPAWLWTAAYWILLGTGILALIRGFRSKR